MSTLANISPQEKKIHWRLTTFLHYSNTWIALLREDWKVIRINFTEDELWRADKLEETSVLVCNVPASWGNENQIPDTNHITLAVCDNEKTSLSNGKTYLLVKMRTCCQNRCNAGCWNQMSFWLKSESFKQIKDCQSKLLEVTKQPSYTEHLLYLKQQSI